MTPQKLLPLLAELGVDLVPSGGDLIIRAGRGVITGELRAAIAEHKTALIEMLAAPGAFEADALRPASRDRRLPLSEFQERLWVMQRLEPDATVHQFAGVWQFADNAGGRLVSAVNDVVRRHELLRSSYPEENGTPFVRIAPDCVEVASLPLPAGDEEALRVINEAVAKELCTPFDLTAETAVRFSIFDGGDRGAVLVACAHHIAVDQWSMALLREEITRALSAPGGPAPALQYADYAVWQRGQANNAATEKQLAWWVNKLAGAPELCMFPATLAGEPAAPAAHVAFALDSASTRALKALTQRHGATLAMAAYAACAAALRAYTELDDIVMGVPIGARERPELETVIGPFVNLVVLRLDLSDDPSFATLLGRTRDAFLDAYDHRAAPFERVVERLNPPRSLVHSPLFQVAVVMHNAVAATEPVLESGGAMYETTWYLREVNGCLEGSLEYRTDLYEAAMMARVAQRLTSVLQEAVADPERPTSRFELMSGPERQTVLETFNDTAAVHDTSPAIQGIVAQAMLTPDTAALTFEGRTLQYRQLMARASATAASLRDNGVGRGMRVGVCLERGPHMLAALLGAQMAGATYVPFDPNFPADRLRFMAQDAEVALVLGDAASRDRIGSGPTWINVAALGEREEPPPQMPAGDDLAYIIYTSGSTGRPNGVAVTHGALSNLLRSMRIEPGLRADDVLVAVTTISFDIAALELYLPLLVGARIELAAPETAGDGERLVELIAASGATVLQATPATWRMLLDAKWSGDPKFRALVGGEPLPPDLVTDLLPKVGELWNLYGPTETTVWSSTGRIQATDGAVTIGRPIANTRIYVLDQVRAPVPIGLPGEIWIAGAGVAAGYHNRPELTAERFAPDPFVADRGRMYRTGDIGRWREDARLVHLGRRDHQVKVRGFRVELAEVEAALASHPAIRQAVVGVSKTSGVANLVAYVVYDTREQEPTASELRRYLRARLPDYMTPALFVGLDALPLTPNGKINRRALPDPLKSGRRAHRSDEPLAKGAEQVIAEVWRDFLHAESVGPHDNFFELGGNSLLSLRVVSAVQSRLGWRMEPRAMFFRTLRELASAASTARPAAD